MAHVVRYLRLDPNLNPDPNPDLNLNSSKIKVNPAMI